MLYKFASAKGKDGLFHPIFKGQYEGGRTNRHPIALQPNLGSKIMSNLVRPRLRVRIYHKKNII
jgi:hypothetical protein